MADSCYSRAGVRFRPAIGPLEEGKTMKNFLAFLAALIIVVAGVGWYLGWFQVSSTPLVNGHKRVSVDVDTNKVKDDVKKGSDTVIHKGKELIEDAVEKATKEAAGKGSSAVQKEVENVFDALKLP